MKKQNIKLLNKQINFQKILTEYSKTLDSLVCVCRVCNSSKKIMSQQSKLFKVLHSKCKKVQTKNMKH
jgi:hypothetical protein